ncbi:MAG: DUF3551 domain-containing protein [Bradyrhizobium sp.]|uniref:DUF3551 domain-containing protein n=1 Tax=Bradyrhizobium sp. TaxID=376 RepID=UPI0025BC52DF|nr:DUF3551 domain-containing protein [Bradyrhizobium sp.]MBI5263222.1 DUF3551 domain-containing protein [Bradyrhizobium sp.]
MRLLACTILALGTVLAAAPAHAQTYDPSYPVCLQIFTGFNDSYYECRYSNINQCRASASGRHAMCVVNPYYQGPRARRSRAYRPYY